MIWKRVALAAAVAAAFLVGYAGIAGAYPTGGVHGRAEYRGYFTNTPDNWGTFVLPAFASYGGNAFPPTLNTADEFINFIMYTKLDIDNNGSGNAHERTGAAFIIHTMLGTPEGQRSRPPTGPQLAEWEASVRAAASDGRISWYYNYSHTINSYYQRTNGNGPGGQNNPNDDAFYDDRDTSTAIVFRNDANEIVYALRRQCANPIGDGNVGEIPDPQSYDITGSSSVSDTTVVPGQSITFRHFVRNAGPDSTAPTPIWWVAERTSPGPIAIVGGAANSGTYTAGQQKTVFTHNNVIIPNNALPGTQFCERVGWDPDNSSGARNGRGAPACATVIADFELSPRVVPSTDSAQQGEDVTFEYRVFNPGPTPSTSTTCKVVGNNRPPGYTPLPQQDVDRNSDPGYTAPPTSCPTNIFVNNIGQLVATETVNVGNATPGSKVCRSLVINPKNESGGFRASQEVCIVISKTPYVHFQGNDVWAGGGFPAVTPACNSASKIATSARALSDGSVAGSGVEYAAFALGKITNFGSAGRAIVNPAAAQGKMLTFTNVDNANLGFYAAAQHCINDYISTYSGTPISSLGNPIDVNRASGTWQLNGPVAFRGTVPNGAQQIYLVNGDVTIDNNIRYSNAYANRNEIPSLVIIATGNILIQDNVQDIAGLFVTRGTFNTCSNAPPGNLSVSICNQQLTVNGAVIAGSLSLLRTHGADGNNNTDRKRPAEIFNFNAEMYLRNALNGGGVNTLRTVDERDLPPRY